MAHQRLRIPPETWKPFPRDQVVDVPFFPRDEWGRDVDEALMLGAEPDFDLTLVPIELPYRVRYDDVIFSLMTDDPPTYWKEAVMTEAALHRARRLIQRAEELRLHVYDDASGKPITSGSYVRGVPTIGYGRALDSNNGIRTDEAAFLLDADLAVRLAGIKRAYFWFDGLDDVRQAAVLEMSFPLGVDGIAKLRRFVNAIADGEYELAASYMLMTKFARDVKSRADRLADMIRTGKWPEVS